MPRRNRRTTTRPAEPTDNALLAASLADGIAAGRYTGARLADAEAELSARAARGATPEAIDAARDHLDRRRHRRD